jgi:hypothetical protein
MRPDQGGIEFFPDGPGLPVLYAANVGPWCCLQAGVDECGLVGSERGFEAPPICSDCGLKSDIVCEPESSCLQAVTIMGVTRQL